MNELAPVRGNAYAGDPDYDGLHLRVVAQHEIVGLTRDGWKVRHCVTVWDFGKPMRTLHDPDAVGRYEGSAAIGVKGYQHSKTVELLARVRALLAVRPMACREIAEATGCPYRQVRGLFTNQPAGFVVVGRGLSGNIWGLA